MGTRGLTMVVLNSETKVSQYGQWDHYPSGKGIDILELISSFNIEKFKEKISKLHWITEEEANKVDENENWETNYPYLSRDAGGQILNAIYNGEMVVSAGIGERKVIKCDVKFLTNKESFAGDSLFCEWAYVIDLDKNTFEIYKGFNKEPLEETERFFNHFKHSEHKGEDDVYYPVKMVKSYSLAELPNGQQFLNDLEPKEKEND